MVLELDSKNKYLFEKYNYFKGHIFQSEAYSNLKQIENWHCLVHVDENDVIDGSMSIFVTNIEGIKATILYSPRGPVCVKDKTVYKEFLDKSYEIGKKYNALALKMDPDISNFDIEYKKMLLDLNFNFTKTSSIQSQYVYRLNIEGFTEENILNKLNKKTRYNIKKVLKKDFKVKERSIEYIDEFYNIMKETGIRKNYDIRSIDYFKRILTNYKNNAIMYIVYKDDEPICGGITVKNKNMAWCLYAGTKTKYIQSSPIYLLHYKRILWAIKNGCRVYDLGGSGWENDVLDSMPGVSKFKKQFGAELIKFIGGIEYYYKDINKEFLN